MNLNFLECFLNLSNSLNFSQTARELKVAQPAVSRQIKNLEEELGTTLFIRNRQGVYLTAEGQRLKAEIGPLYQNLKERLSAFQSHTEGMKGVISFGCFREVGEKIFTPLINKFKDEYPEVEIRARFLKAHDISEGVKTGELDFGVVPISVTQENIRAYEIFREDVVLVTRSSNLSEPKSLKDLRVVAYREDDPMLIDYLRQKYSRFHMGHVNFFVTVNSHKAMVEILLAHDTWAVLPHPSVEKELKEGKLRLASDKKMVSILNLIHFEHEVMEKRKLVFREYIMKNVREIPHNNLAGWTLG